MKSKLKKLAQEVGITTLSFSIALVILLGVNVVKAWTEPGANPPAGNLGAPLNTSVTGQTKQGGLILNTSGAVNGLIVQNGNVGIGDTTPAALFVVGNGDLFQVNASGNLVKINNVTYSWPAAQAGGSSYVLANNGSGTLSWTNPNSLGIVTPPAGANGQVQFNNSGAFGANANLFWDNANSRLGIGTASPASSLSVGAGNQFQVNSTGNIVKINNITYSWPGSQGAASKVLTNDGAGNLTWSPTSATPAGANGQVQFNNSGAFGANANFSWDNTNSRLGIGTASPNPSATMTVVAAHPVGASPWPLYLKSTVGGGDGVYLGSDGSNGFAIGRGTDGVQMAHIQSNGTIMSGAIFAAGTVTASGHNFYAIPWATMTARSAGCFNGDASGGIQNGNALYLLACISVCDGWCRDGSSGVIYSGGTLTDWGAGFGYCTCLP